MSRNEDYLDDLLNSVSSRDDRRDIADLLDSVREGEERANRARENRERRKNFGSQFYKEFEEELGIDGESEEDFIRNFELELDAEEAGRHMDDFPTEVYDGDDEADMQDSTDEASVQSVDGIFDEAKKLVDGEGSELKNEDEGLDNFPAIDEGMPEELPEEQIQDEEALSSEAGDESADDLLQMLTGLSEDSDLSDIGALLKAEENGEEITPEDNEDDMEMLESIQALSGISSGKKGKSQKEKKKGVLAKIMAALFGDDEDEKPVHVSEEGTLDNISDENLDILRTLDSTEQKDVTPAKEKKKKEKAAKKEKPKKEKKVKPKKVKKPKEPDLTPPLPKKPVILIVVMAASVFLFILLGSNFLSYSNDMTMAKESYAGGNYVEAYSAIAGRNMNEKDQLFYNKCAVMAMVQSEYHAYITLMDSGEYEMALDSLIRGIGRYDKYYERAEEYDILLEYNQVELQIEQVLAEQFGVTADQARELYNMRRREDYSIGVQQILENLGLE